LGAVQIRLQRLRTGGLARARSGMRPGGKIRAHFAIRAATPVNKIPHI